MAREYRCELFLFVSLLGWFVIIHSIVDSFCIEDFFCIDAGKERLDMIFLFSFFIEVPPDYFIIVTVVL